MNEEDENDIENEESSEQQENISSPGGGRGLVNKGRKAGKDLLKKGGEALRQGIEGIWKALPPTAKLWIIGILVFIILIALVMLSLNAQAAEWSKGTTKSYYESLTTPTEGSNLYKKTGSLLLSTDEEIKKMSELYYEELENADENLRSDMMIKYKDGDKENSEKNLQEKAVGVTENKELYQHILNTERYNFNRIIWQEFNGGKRIEDSNNNPIQPKMQVDEKTRLQYPIDNLGTTLEGFANMVRPYLQTWVIPYSMYVGVYSDGSSTESSKNSKFAYELISNAYHKITINKYNMENLTTVTKQNIYDEKKMKVTVTVTCVDVPGPLEPGQTVRPQICTKSEPVETFISETPCESYEKDKSYHEIPGKEERYYTKEIKTFDSNINYEYEYRKYNKSDEPDELGISRVAYNVEEGEKTPKVDETKAGEYTSTYIVKDGYTETTTRVYKDKIDQKSYEKRPYKVSDVEEYIKDETLDDFEKVYYNDYEQEQVLNRYDMINAKKDIYSKYIPSGDEYSKSIGYHRDFVRFGLYSLEQNMLEIQNEYKNSFAYGASLGITEAESTNAPGIDVSSPETIDYSSIPEGGFVWPAPGISRITSHSQLRRDIVVKGVRQISSHIAIDIGTPMKTKIVSSHDGEVTLSRWQDASNHNKGYGQYIIIKHANGYETLYAHMEELHVKVGDKVERGQVIGLSGTTGNSQGPHLHYEIRKNGVKQNPEKYVNATNTMGNTLEISELKIAETEFEEKNKQEEIIQELNNLEEEAQKGQNLNANEQYRKYVNETYFTGWQDTYVINGPKYSQTATEMNYPNMPRFQVGSRQKDLAGSGCGPTATAMVVTGLTGERKWGPWEVYDWVVDNGLMTENSGGENNLPKKFIEANYGNQLKVISKGVSNTAGSTKKDIISAIKNKSAIILLVGSANYAFPNYSAEKYYTGVGHFIAITGIKDNTNDEQVYVHDSGNKIKFDSSQSLDTIIKVIQNTDYYIISRKEGYNPEIHASVDPNIDATGSNTGRVITTEEIGPATTTGWCKDFKPINWSSVGVSTATADEGSTSTSGPPTPGDSTGVLAAMQNFYKEGGLQGRTDYSGLTWEKVPFYSANAQYALDHHKDMIFNLAPEYGVDPLHVMAKMAFESSGGRNTGFGSGPAAGPMQIEKRVHLNNSISAYNVISNKTDTIVMSRENLGDTETNIRIGIMMYANILKQTGGNPFIAAQRYNMGNTVKWLPNYANRVGKSQENIMKEYNDVGWLYDVMRYHNEWSESVGERRADGYYAYKFAMYLDWLQQKLQ